MNGKQAQIQIEKSPEQELEEFEKVHSKPFLYILEQYEKWQKLKRKVRESQQQLVEGNYIQRKRQHMLD